MYIFLKEGIKEWKREHFNVCKCKAFLLNVEIMFTCASFLWQVDTLCFMIPPHASIVNPIPYLTKPILNPHITNKSLEVKWPSSSVITTNKISPTCMCDRNMTHTTQFPTWHLIPALPGGYCMSNAQGLIRPLVALFPVLTPGIYFTLFSNSLPVCPLIFFMQNKLKMYINLFYLYYY